MTDEKYTFVQDLRDKKRTARGARNRRTHCGKGGAVKFPSDYMTRKELKAMNGEVKSYNINSPMQWAEYKALPDDIKIVYIKTLREKYGVPDTRIGKDMLGVSQKSISKEIARLGLSCGRGNHWEFDAKGWNEWLSKAVCAPESASEPVCEPANGTTPPVTENAVESSCEANSKVIPCKGAMVLDGKAGDSQRTVESLLGGADVRLMVSWEVL